MMEFAAGAGVSPVSSVVGPGVRVRAAAADPGCGPGGVTDERFAAGGFFDARDMVQVKYEMVRTTREDGPSVTAAATAFWLSRQSCYQAAAAREGRGWPARSRRPWPKAAEATAEVMA